MFLVFAACLLIYAITLHAAVGGGDSGELTFVAYRLGVAHPPGYPLFTLLAHAFTSLPFGTVAVRVNLLSAVCGAGAAAFLFDIVRRSTRDSVAAWTAAFLFAFSPLIATYSTVAEVFALNNLFVALVLWLALRWNETRDLRDAIPIAFTIGLALTNHHTFVLVAVPLIVWMLVVSRGSLLRPASAVRLVLAGAVGLLPYVYLPLAAHTADTLSWGEPATISGFLDMLLRRDYGTFGLQGDQAVRFGDFAEHLRAAGATFASASLWIGSLFTLAAFVPGAGGRRGRSFVVLLAVALVFSVSTFAALANLPIADPLYYEVTARFWQQPQVLWFVLVGIGLANIRSFVQPRFEIVLAGFAVLLVTLQLAGHFQRFDRNNRYVADFGRAILAGLPDRAVLLVYGDLISNATRYMQACEGVRPDVTLLVQEMMTKPWYIERARREHPEIVFPASIYHPFEKDGFSMEAFLDANGVSNPIYVYPGVKAGDVSWRTRYGLLPVGLGSLVVPKDEAAGEAAFERVASGSGLEAARAAARPDESRYLPGTWERVVLADYRNAFHDRAQWLLDRALARSDSHEMLVQARDALQETATLWHGPPPWYVAKNLGLASSKLADSDGNARATAVRAWRSYLETAPPDEADRDDIREALRELER